MSVSSSAGVCPPQSTWARLRRSAKKPFFPARSFAFRVVILFFFLFLCFPLRSSINCNINLTQIVSATVKYECLRSEYSCKLLFIIYLSTFVRFTFGVRTRYTACLVLSSLGCAKNEVERSFYKLEAVRQRSHKRDSDDNQIIVSAQNINSPFISI